MKYIAPVILLFIVLSACNNSADKKEVPVATGGTATEKPSFFPVTAYIKGQLHAIVAKNVNPLKYTTQNGHTDSAWLKIEDLNTAAKDFLTPQIDSTNLTGLFSESRFVDRSLEDALTFTYDPINKLPDTMQLTHWDVYADGKTGAITRVFLAKNIAPGKQLQLTWVNDQYFTIRTVASDKNGTLVEKEEKIRWDF